MSIIVKGKTIYGPNIVTDGLVLYLDAANTKSYPTTGTTWSDLSGYRNNGTLTNGPTFSSANNGSIFFDGTNEYINLSPVPSLSNISKFTYSSFIKFQSKANGCGIFSYGQTNVYTSDIFFWWNTTSPNNSLAFQINNGLDGTAWYSYNPTSSWISLAVVYDGTQSTNANKLKVYLNNDQITLDFNTYTVPASTASPINPKCLIGDYASTTGTYTFLGNVATTILYNRSLSTIELTQNYNASKSRFNL